MTTETALKVCDVCGSYAVGSVDVPEYGTVLLCEHDLEAVNKGRLYVGFLPNGTLVFVENVGEKK